MVLKKKPQVAKLINDKPPICYNPKTEKWNIYELGDVFSLLSLRVGLGKEDGYWVSNSKQNWVFWMTGRIIMRINVVVALLLQVTFDMKNETYICVNDSKMPPPMIWFDSSHARLHHHPAMYVFILGTIWEKNVLTISSGQRWAMSFLPRKRLQTAKQVVLFLQAPAFRPLILSKFRALCVLTWTTLRLTSTWTSADEGHVPF